MSSLKMQDMGIICQNQMPYVRSAHAHFPSLAAQHANSTMTP